MKRIKDLGLFNRVYNPEVIEVGLEADLALEQETLQRGPEIIKLRRKRSPSSTTVLSSTSQPEGPTTTELEFLTKKRNATSVADTLSTAQPKTMTPAVDPKSKYSEEEKKLKERKGKEEKAKNKKSEPKMTKPTIKPTTQRRRIQPSYRKPVPLVRRLPQLVSKWQLDLIWKKPLFRTPPSNEEEEEEEKEGEEEKREEEEPEEEEEERLDRR